MELRPDVRIQIERWIEFNYDFCPFASTFEWGCTDCNRLFGTDKKECPYRMYGKTRLQNMFKQILLEDNKTTKISNDSITSPSFFTDDEEDFYI